MRTTAHSRDILTATSHPLLSIKGLRFAYSGIPAIEDVSIDVDEGEAVCIVGPNGAGKTTLAKTIVGINRPAAGIVSFGGSIISDLRASKIPTRGIGTVLEGRHVFPGQTVQANLELGAYWRRLGRAQLHEEMQRVFELFPDLRLAVHKAAGDLSGGQQQMLCVGRALMGNPRLLILDEPSMGLSPRLAAELYAALSSLRDDGLAILVIEQNAQLAFQFCSRGYVLQHGRVVVKGSVDELRATDLVHRIYLGAERLSERSTSGAPTGGDAHEREEP